ncbi:MAG: Na+/H+ antiporter subunit D [Trueperaceae bacterium]|nr:Na+/H+ antiporter subunit D [Trueperaceae bacterium]
MSWLLVLPIIIPLVTAAVLFAFGKRTEWQKNFSFASTLFLLLTGILLLVQVAKDGILVAQMGSWRAPFGISLVADLLSAIMVLITGVMGFAIAIYARKDIGPRLEHLGFHPVYHVLLAGINGAFITGDLFNLYVWFEVLLISSFVLLTLGGNKAQLKGGVHYVLINLFSSLLFLTAIGILYGLTGTLNMADLARQLAGLPAGLVTTVAILFLIAFGVKAAVFPLFFWLPSSYHTPPMATTAIFAAMLSKVGVYALVRAFTLLFTQDPGYTHNLLAWIAALTMFTGVLGAAAQTDIRKILSFHSISQIGYMIMGLALFSSLGFIGAVFYIVHHSIVKASLFLVAGLIKREGGSFELSELGGLYKRKPLLAVLFLILAFSLAGFPPLSGFWAKLIVIRAGLEAEAYWLVAVSLVVGLLTIYSMTKIWQAVFWKPAESEPVKPVAGSLRPLYMPIAGLALVTLMIGFFAQPFYVLAESAASQLLNSQLYISSVLGDLIGAKP